MQLHYYCSELYEIRELRCARVLSNLSTLTVLFLYSTLVVKILGELYFLIFCFFFNNVPKLSLDRHPVVGISWLPGTRLVSWLPAGIPHFGCGFTLIKIMLYLVVRTYLVYYIRLAI